MILTLNSVKINDCQNIYIDSTLDVLPVTFYYIKITVNNLTTNISEEYISPTNFTPVITSNNIVVDLDTLKNFDDGVYCITVQLIATSNQQILTEANKYVLSLCTLCCKLKTLASKVKINDCQGCNEPNNQNILKFIEADALFTAIQYGGTCGSISEINSNIKNLNDFLININCKNC